MRRQYTKLECGCLVSCDDGGGLIPCTYKIDNPNCCFEAYMEKHVMLYGYCKVCHPNEFKIALYTYGTTSEKRRYL